MDKNEQLQIILAENKGVIFLSLVDRIDRFKEITSSIQNNVDLEKISEKLVGKIEEKGKKHALKRRIEEYEDPRALVSFVYVNDMQFYIDFYGYRFEGLMPVKMGKELKRKAKEFDFVVINTTTLKKGQSTALEMNTFAVKGIKRIKTKG